MTFTSDRLRELAAEVALRDADLVAIGWRADRQAAAGLAADIARAGFDLVVLLALARLHALTPDQQDLLEIYRGALAVTRSTLEIGP